MESSAQLMWGVLFGAIGVGYFMYGKKQKVAMPFYSGIALCIAPYFISNVYGLVLSGLVLVTLPYFVKI